MFSYNQSVSTTQKFWLPQKLHSPLGLFGLKSFHGFVILVGRIEPLACLVLCLVMKMWQNIYKKPYQTWKTVNIQKTSKFSNTNTKKERNTISKICRRIYTVYSPSFFERGEWKLGQLGKLGRRGDHFFKKIVRTKREGREKIQNLYEWWDVFVFNLLAINYHGIWHCFYI